jgi:thioredoxin reductase
LSSVAPAPAQVAILGAGPAGLSAALWLKNLGLDPWLLESSPRPGGMQNLNFLPNDWVLGHVGLTGPQLIDRFVAHAEQAGVVIRRGWHPTEISGRSGDFRLQLASEQGEMQALSCAALLVATGTRYRGSEVLAQVPGFSAIPAERLVFGPYAFAELDACAGRRIVVLGGGDNAYENVRLLVERGAQVDLVLRSPPRAQQHLRTLVDQAAASGACRIHQAASLSELAWSAPGITVSLVSAQGSTTLTADRIHVLAGYEPNGGFLDVLADDLRSPLHRDAQGYLMVDAQGRTNVPGIYAAGDICNPVFPSVVSAIAQGAQAAKTIELDFRKH